MRMLLGLLVLIALGGCVSVAKVESGDRAVGERMAVTLEGAWNKVSWPNQGPAEIWTMEGTPVDQLLLYSGIKNDQVVHAEPAGAANAQRKSFRFRSNMQPDDIVSMFEGMLTRDGSRFKLAKLEPTPFGGLKGFRFDFDLTRKIDNVQLKGMGYGVVSKDELFAIVYMAPQLAFFPRHVAKVEQIGRSARIREGPAVAKAQ